jgi:predicted component of type VI protein secretion system
VPEESISKRHCVFEIGAEGVTVVDTGSTNGTSVGGRALAPHEPCILVGGEALEIGNFSFLFHTPETFVAYLRTFGGGV